MPLAKKEEGYPVDAGAAATATVEKPAEAAAPAAAPRTIQGKDSAAVQPSAKDRSIVRQVAWKVAGFALANWTGSPEQWFEKCQEVVRKIEADIHGA